MPSFKTLGQQTTYFCPKFIFGCMGGGRWAWPIFIKLSTLLRIIIEMTYAKFQNFWSTNKHFLTKIHFRLYGRWAWPIFIKLPTLLTIIIELTYAKFQDFRSTNNNFLPEIHFRLYGRWAVGVADFHKSSYFS